MANPTLCSSFIIILFLFLFFVPFSSPQITRLDKETSSKLNNCFHEIDSELWGERCRASTIERQNCALRCVSPVCYEIIYQSDPLEEGERDFFRSQEFMYCMRRVLRHGDHQVVHQKGGVYTLYNKAGSTV